VAALAFSVPALADEVASSTLALIADMPDALLVGSVVGGFGAQSVMLQLKGDQYIYNVRAQCWFPSVDTHDSPFITRHRLICQRGTRMARYEATCAVDSMAI
jgi:hypothetical protein